MATAESARSALFIAFGEVIKKVLCALKMLRFCLQVVSKLGSEMPAALLLHVTRYSIFSNSSIILPGIRASIGVTRSYSSRPFLCTLGTRHKGEQSMSVISQADWCNI